MASIRPFLLAAALPFTLVACGGDDGGVDQPTPEGPHYQTVSKKVLVPTNNSQAREYGLDIGSSDGELDGTVDNQLGMVLGTLATMGFDIQATIDGAVAEGSIILLADFQTSDFMNTTAAGLKILLGDKATAMPAPCNDGETYDEETKTGCGRHLAGTGNFTIAAGSPNDAAVAGKIVNGVFTGGPGNITLQIALGGTDAIQLDLIGARAKATGISGDAITSLVLGGALTENDLNTKVIPAIQAQIAPIVTEDCPGTAPSCNCTSGSTGATVLDLFDANDNCEVSVEEIATNQLIQSLLAPDVKIEGTDALSLGVKVETTKATFPAQN
ncbi:MAG: hypothetical protein SFX73_23775 [Kofleriaceae bacterium]|nr:hypothetical protein [Kofleriaceae bacterium]